jgi:hypothetical protein
MGMEKYDEMREVIRLHDNEKYGVLNYYGKKDYAPMSITQVEERLTEGMIEKARKQNG